MSLVLVSVYIRQKFELAGIRHLLFLTTYTSIGPNAPTPDSLFQQLMNNNATWTVIDRGEPGSYFSIWDLVDYMGQGGHLQDQCDLLREVWEEMALSNSPGGSKELLEMVMKNSKEKQMMYDFVQHLIDSMVPKNHVGFDSDLADQFERALKKGVDILKGGEYAAEVSGNPSELFERSLEELDEEAKFELVKGTAPYDLAADIMLEAKSTDWSKYFVYYSDTFASEILEKGERTYCRFL